ncbi:MAG: hypothetical protein ACOVNZ_06440 [Crocinitomicaceae bacterium]|jgi:hypothetical protein
MTFIAKTWNNSHRHATGAGYGIKIKMQDREQFFNRSWQSVILRLSGNATPIEVNVGKPSFWNRTCGELISQEIGLWLQRNNAATWPPRRPHRVRLTVIGEREFKVELI